MIHNYILQNITRMDKYVNSLHIWLVECPYLYPFVWLGLGNEMSISKWNAYSICLNRKMGDVVF